MSMDPVFVAEFANAGFLADVPEELEEEFTEDRVESAIEASTWQGELVAVPFWANTQVLWYRKSVAEAAGLDMSKPVTWEQITEAADVAPMTFYRHFGTKQALVMDIAFTDQIARTLDISRSSVYRSLSLKRDEPGR